MRYNVFFNREDGTPAPNPSPIDANGIVDAQRLAQAVLEDMQNDGYMDGWAIKTVVEA